MDFNTLVDNSVQVMATIEKLVVSKHSNNDMILLNDIYVNGEFFRDHAWIKMTKRLSVVVVGDKITASAPVVKYFDTETNREDKIGLKSFRNVVVTNSKVC